MTKHKRIQAPRSWIMIASLFALLLLILVVVAVVLAQTPKGPDSPQNGSTGRATSADLYCLEFSRYSGEFIEDGTHQSVKDVAAALIENRSQEFLDLATITYDVGGKTAKFVVTGLPPGTKTWVLETNRMTIGNDVRFNFIECTSTFRQNAILSTEDLELSSTGNSVSVKNTSDHTLTNVCVYYKSLNADGSFLGGITYMLTFDTLKPGQSIERSSAHFTQSSRIVRYSYQLE